MDPFKDDITEGLSPEQEAALDKLFSASHPLLGKDQVHEFEFKVHYLNPGELIKSGATGSMTAPAGMQFIGMQALHQQAGQPFQAVAFFMRRKPTPAERAVQIISQATDAAFFQEIATLAVTRANGHVSDVLTSIIEGEDAPEGDVAEVTSFAEILAGDSTTEVPATQTPPVTPAGTFSAPLDESAGATTPDASDLAAAERALAGQLGEGDGDDE